MLASEPGLQNEERDSRRRHTGHRDPGKKLWAPFGKAPRANRGQECAGQSEPRGPWFSSGRRERR